MNNKDKFYPGFNDENLDRDKQMKDDLGAEVNKDDLAYNAEGDSFELDVESRDQEYDHPDPYNTSVKNGSDFDSDYDEANVTAVNEYDRPNDPAETDMEEFGMHVDKGGITKLREEDAALSQTEEDQREDLDEEGYPKNNADPHDSPYLK